MNAPQPSRWPELFDMAMAIIDQANGQGIGMHNWSFGGGTALMLQIRHRESHDIDLFIDDAQYLPYPAATAEVWLRIPCPTDRVSVSVTLVREYVNC